MAANARQNRRIVETAYCQVFKISKDELTKPEHKEALNNALIRLWEYPELYQGETPEMRNARLDFNGPANGEASELAYHLKQLFPEFDGETTWAVIFRVYDRMNPVEPEHNGDEPVKDEAVVISPEVVKEETGSDKIHNQEGEIIMSETKPNSLQELENAVKGTDVGGSIVETGTLPRGENSTEMQAAAKAAKDAIMKESASRQSYSLKATVTELVLSKPSATELAVNGTATKGTVKDAATLLRNFCTKTGFIADQQTDEVNFTNIPLDPENLANAKAIYKALKDAIANPTMEFDTYFSKGTGALKGIKLEDGTGTAAVYIPYADVINIIMQKTVGVLKTNTPGVQLLIRSANARANHGTKGNGTAKKAKKDSFSGVASVAVSNKADGLEKMAVYHKEKANSTSTRSGMKSMLAVRYFRKTTDATNASQKVGTYRIPLLVEQYDVAVVDKDKLEVFGSGVSAGGQSVQPIDLSNSETVSSMMSALVSVTAAASVKGIRSNSLLASVTESAREAVNADAAAQASEMGAGTL